MPDQGGWYGLLAIVQEAKDVAAQQRSEPPVACPDDGEPLRTGPRGELHCPYCGEVYR